MFSWTSWNGDNYLKSIDTLKEEKLNSAADQVISEARNNILRAGAVRTGSLYASVRKSRTYQVGNESTIDVFSDMSYSMIEEKRISYLMNALRSLTKY